MSDESSAIAKLDSYLGLDVNSLAGQIGMAAAQRSLHLSFPNDFEFYMMALELTDYLGNTIDYFVFPINPRVYSQDEPSATNVRKTMGGVSATGNSSFNPIDIRISGDFGRKFKVMIGKDVDNQSVAVAQYSTTSGVYSKEGINSSNPSQFRKPVFDVKVKTGYGATKILQAICDKSRGDIQGKPNQLYMYNPAFNSNFLVKVVSFNANQSSQSGNFIWTYELTLKAIAPLEMAIGSSRVNRSLAGALTRSIVQDVSNTALKVATNILLR